MKKLKVLFFLGFTLPLAASAAEISPVGQSVSGNNGLSLERLDFSYAALVKGSTIQYLNGDSNGKGTNLSLRHYPTLGFKITDKWKADFGGQFRQYFRPADPKKKDQKDYEWRDPYVGISRKDLWKSEDAFVAGKLRYFLPISAYNISYRDKEYDEGKGAAQLGFSYGRKFADGLLSLYTPLEMNYRFNGREHKVRQDYWFGMRPNISCRLGQKTSVKAEYYTGDLNHRTDGTWTKFNDKVLGQTAGLGLDWYPVKDLLVAPMVNWGRESFRFNAAELTLYAKYAFL